MSTQKQIEANRRNAQRSTGPKTPEGKARSALNALQHGIRSSLAVIPGESLEEFETLYDAIRDDFQPTDSMEEILVRQIASAEWRLQRIQRAEAALLWREMNTSASFPWRRHPEPDAPYQADSDDEITLYRQAGAFSMLVVHSDRLSSFSRYETALRNTIYKAMQTLEARAKLRQQQAPAPAPDQPKIAQSKPIPKKSKKNQQHTDPTPIPAQPTIATGPDPGHRKAS